MGLSTGSKLSGLYTSATIVLTNQATNKINRHKHAKQPMPLGPMSRQAVCFCVFLCVFLIGLVNGKSQATNFDFVFIGLSKTGLVSIR